MPVKPDRGGFRNSKQLSLLLRNRRGVAASLLKTPLSRSRCGNCFMATDRAFTGYFSPSKMMSFMCFVSGMVAEGISMDELLISIAAKKERLDDLRPVS